VRKINFIQDTVVNHVILTMVAGVNDGAEHRATRRSKRKGIKGHGEGGEHSPTSSSTQPTPQPVPGEAGATRGDQTEPDTEIAGSGLPELE